MVESSNTSHPGSDAKHISRCLPHLDWIACENHQRAVRCLGFTLEIGHQDAWWGFSKVLRARLSVPERAALAFMSIKSLDASTASMTAKAALDGAGMPRAPFIDPADEAGFWAGMASEEELEAYCVATFLALPPHRQAAFCDYVGRAA